MELAVNEGHDSRSGVAQDVTLYGVRALITLGRRGGGRQHFVSDIIPLDFC